MLSVLKTSYNNLLRLISTYRAAALVIIGVFILGVISAFIIPEQRFINIFLNVLDKFASVPSKDWELFRWILVNNSQTALISIISSVLILPPLLITYLNGLNLGVFIEFMSALQGYIEFWSLAPHGIIELPAFLATTFLSLLLSLKLMFKKRIEPSLSRRQFFALVLTIYLFLLLPLFIAAAFVETYVTPLVIERFIKSSSANTVNPSLALSANQLADIGIKAELLPNSLEEKNFCHNINLKMAVIQTFLFQDDYDISASPASMVQYYALDPGQIMIQILEADLPAAELEKKMTDRIAKLAEYQPEVAIAADHNVFRFQENNQTCYFTFGQTGGYIYYLNYNNNDYVTFKKVVSAQTKLLSSQSPNPLP